MERRRFLELGVTIGFVRCFHAIAQDVDPRGAISDSRRHRPVCLWQERKHGSYICDLAANNPGPIRFTKLFVNGDPQVLARFPNVDASGASVYLNAVRFLPPGLIVPDPQDGENGRDLVAIEFNPATFSQKRWGNPEEAVLCLKNDGGDVRLPVRDMDYDRNLIWCNPGKDRELLHLESVPQFYVENVYEELDAPHEWYLNRPQGILYYRPPDNTDMNTALIEVA